MLEYDSKKQEIILAQWQTCVKMANSVSQRRDTLNKLFVSLNIAILTAVSIGPVVRIIPIFAAGILACILWVLSIKYYRKLNSAKFEIIKSLENDLPLQPFADEWQRLKNCHGFIEATVIELLLPWIFIEIYQIYIVVFIVKSIYEV